MRSRLGRLGALGAVGLACLSGCGATGGEIDLSALSARDLLGLAPEIAEGWDEGERAIARAAIERAARAAGSSERARLGFSSDRAGAILASVADIDFEREIAGRDVVPFASATVETNWVVLAPISPDRPTDIELVASGWPRDDAALLDRDPRLIAALAIAAGHPREARLVVSPIEREPIAALYLPERGQLLVNPIYLASLAPTTAGSANATLSSPHTRARSAAAGPGAPPPGGAITAATTGNPYSFFGSVGECGAAERIRCDGCLAASSCQPESRDQSDGALECQALGEGNGRGYYLFCVNLAAAIDTVAECIADSAPACPLNREAGNLLSALDANAALIDDPICLAATDQCLADIYGPSDTTFPPPPQPTDPPPPPPPPPRRTDISCGESSINCDFSPEIGCSGGSCSAAPSCGSCEGGSCEGGSCEGGSCDSCNSCDDNGGCEVGSCNSCDSDGGGSCGGGSCVGGSCNGEDCGSGGGGKCSSAPAGGGSPWLVAMMWGLLPLIVIRRLHRREGRR